MSYNAQVFRILIASPSDVTEERDIAVRTIQEWNDLNSPERRIVLLPLRWETHSAPEFGNRPQEIINRQVVDHCDMLVGVFWARIGTPTGKSDSGTLEEIERVAQSGKPVMLYFSKAKQDPDQINLEQLQLLREFKEKTLPNALIEHYSSQIEFRDKLAKQLEIQLRSLIAEETEGSTPKPIARPVTDIQLEFSDIESATPKGSSIKLETRFVNVTDFEQVRDYEPPPPNENKDKKQAGSGGSRASLPGLQGWRLAFPNERNHNKNYYRQFITYQVQQSLFRPVRFWLKNTGGIGARDVYVALKFSSEGADIILVEPHSIPSSPPSPTKEHYGLLSTTYREAPEEIVKNSGRSWSTSLEVKALQPQREFSPERSFLIGAIENCTVNIQAEIFADTLPEPVKKTLTLEIEVTEINISARELIPDEDVIAVQTQNSRGQIP